MHDYDGWLDNHGNPGIWPDDDLDLGPSEDQIINWNEANEYTDQDDQGD